MTGGGGAFTGGGCGTVTGGGCGAFTGGGCGTFTGGGGATVTGGTVGSATGGAVGTATGGVVGSAPGTAVGTTAAKADVCPTPSKARAPPASSGLSHPRGARPPPGFTGTFLIPSLLNKRPSEPWRAGQPDALANTASRRVANWPAHSGQHVVRVGWRSGCERSTVVSSGATIRLPVIR